LPVNINYPCCNEKVVLLYFRLVTRILKTKFLLTGEEQMTIQRLGTTEGMSVPGMQTVPIISYALVHNDVVSLCGIPGDPVGDVKVQTRQVLERIDQLLQLRTPA
jgi:hypothetical protein